MTTFAGRTALVTGGGSGLGLLMGRMMLEAGADRLIVFDASAENLAAARAVLAPFRDETVLERVDVSDLDALRAVLERLEAAGHAVDVLVNNAGIVVGKPFAEHAHADVDRTMAINAAAPMHLTLALLPGMIARGGGHVVNIASAAALVSNPRMSVYCASKWALTGWSDSLRQEMERAGTGVRVTTVMPYYIRTGMFDGVRSRVLPIQQPEVAANRILRGIERDAVFVHLPRIVRLLPLLRGLLPTRGLDFVLNRIFGVAASMEAFRGRGAPDPAETPGLDQSEPPRRVGDGRT